DDTARYISKKYAKMFGEGFLQDVHIWKNKVPVQNPLLCEEDGPVYQLRRWYEQFYVDKADITPEMVDRFEFEVDTTKANEYWQAEVAENLRRRAEQVKATGSEATTATADAGWVCSTRPGKRRWRTSVSTSTGACARSPAWTAWR